MRSRIAKYPTKTFAIVTAHANAQTRAHQVSWLFTSVKFREGGEYNTPVGCIGVRITTKDRCTPYARQVIRQFRSPFAQEVLRRVASIFLHTPDPQESPTLDEVDRIIDEIVQLLCIRRRGKQRRGLSKEAVQQQIEYLIEQLRTLAIKVYL